MGSEKYIPSPEFLWTKFLEYQEYAKTNPILVPSYTSKDGSEYIQKRIRPISIQGFEKFLLEADIISDLKDYWYGTDGYENFADVIKRIKTYIVSEQIDLALTGVIKENLVARLNGISDKMEKEVRVKEQPLFILPEKKIIKIEDHGISNDNSGS
jgi:hypothetical protein